MKKTVNFCGNCPFLYSDYDDFAVGCSTVDICNLARFLKKSEDCISVHDGYDNDTESSTPEWCPLKEEEFIFYFKDFSSELLNEISSTKSDIKKLEEFFDMREDEVDYDDPIIEEKSEKIKELYNKLDELYNNEDSNFEEDLTEQLDKFKEQLLSLEDLGIKLTDTFNNLGL